MYVSKYTFIISHKNRNYLYNTLSNALIEINQETYSLIKEAKEKNDNIIIDKLDAEICTILKEKHFIVDNDYDELLLYKSIIFSQREQTEFMHLTLAPTMECNFSCFYCFETEKPKGKMTSQTMENIIRYIQTMKNLRKLYLTWFGGEPLLAADIIESMADRIMTIANSNGIQHTSAVVTNGYLLSEKILRMLEKHCVERI